MLALKQVCEELKHTEMKNFEKRKPSIELDISSNPKLQQKVFRKFKDYWKSKANASPHPKFYHAGCCEVGHLSGSELFYFFTNIFMDDYICKPGNCLYLSINQSTFSGILFLGSNQPDYPLFPNFIPVSPQRSCDKFMFTKLFSDKDVLK